MTMKRLMTSALALFGLVMVAMPSVASAGIVRVYPRNVQPMVVQEVVAPAPFTTVEYYRPWACANPWFRHHHRWMCR
jgi:hypothetical protein